MQEVLIYITIHILGPPPLSFFCKTQATRVMTNVKGSDAHII
jgi:hypothetical protein